MASIFKQAKQHIRLTKRLNITVMQQCFLVLAIVGFVLYTVLFTTTPAVHDFFHEFRHNLMLVPCH